MSEHEVLIEPLEGEQITVEFERPEVLKRAKLAAKMPDGFAERMEEAQASSDDDETAVISTLTDADLDWFDACIHATTDLPDDASKVLPVESYFNLVEPAIRAATDQPLQSVTIEPDGDTDSVMDIKEKA